jgi:uncharacterized protein (TIGR03437 family)
MNVSVPMSLVLAEPSPPAVSPASLVFAHRLGGPAPAEQAVSVSNPTGPVRFTAQATTSSGIDWLTAVPAEGSTPGVIHAGINIARLVPGQHTGTLTIAVESTPPKTLTVTVAMTVTGSAVQVQEVVNSASFEPTAVSPGLLVTLNGLGLGPAEPVAGRPSSAGAFPTELAGVRVYVDDAIAPLLLVSNERVNAIVPYAISGRTSVRIQVQNGEGYSMPIEVKAVDTAPAIFTQAQAGRGAAAAFNADSSIISALNPAKRGSAISVYVTGEGQTDPPGQDGRVITTDVRKPLLPVTATIGGQAAEVLYAGSAPLSVSGICQVNLHIPDDVASGRLALEIQIGGRPSQRGVVIDIQ